MMIPTNRVTTHPGEFLREDFLAPLRMSGAQLARAIGVPANRITELVAERRGVTADTAFRLSRYFGTTPEFWLNAQTAFDLTSARQAHRAEYKKILPRCVA
jgi:antitoxin HigA-1